MSKLRNLTTGGWIVVGLATFAATVFPAVSQSAAASTSVRSTPGEALLAALSDPAAHSADFFGEIVAVSGNTAIVGAPGTTSDVGAAYIYVKGPSGWPEQPTVALAPNSAESKGFGESVAVSENTAVVGGAVGNAGAAYIYVKGASGWPERPTTTLLAPAGDDSFGSALAVSGHTLVVGAEAANSDAGAAYIYVKGASGWPTTPTTTLSNPGTHSDDYFGESVAASGNTVIVGATNMTNPPDAGAAYIYVKGASGWPERPTVRLSDPTAKLHDWFGYSVAVSGNTAVVSATAASSYAGAAYIYVKSASGWPEQPTVSLSDPATHSEDAFGYSVAVSGNKTVVGAVDTRSHAGAAYIYVKGASGWPATPTTTLSNAGAQSNDLFGVSVAASGNTAVVGALGPPSDAGAVFIYRA
jgi:hypothetical protein